MSAAPTDQIVARLRRLVVDEISRLIDAAEVAGHQVPADDDQQMAAQSVLVHELRTDARDRLNSGAAALTPEEEDGVHRRVMELVFSTAPGIDRLLAIDDVEDILINGYDDVRLILTDGTTRREDPIGESDAELIETIQAIARRGGNIEKEFTTGSWSLDLQLADGSRLAAASWVTGRPYIAIRRHLLVDADLGDLVGRGLCDPGVASLLAAAVRARMNVLIAGGQGGGKTTLMRALLHECHPDERIAVLEQEPELHLDHRPDRHNHVLLFTERLANTEGVGAVTLADLAKTIKRFRPERIVVGEVRGPEVIDMLEALTQGIAGGMCTLHADSSVSVFARLPVYARAGGRDWRTGDVLALAALGLDLVVFLTRDTTGRRVIAEVRHVESYDQLHEQVITNPWFHRGPDGGAAVPNPQAPIPVDLLDRLVEHGYDPSLHDQVGVW